MRVTQFLKVAVLGIAVLGLAGGCEAIDRANSRPKGYVNPKPPPPAPAAPAAPVKK